MDGILRYIQVAVPLKLSWNPTYSTDDPGISVGDRVKVRIAGHLHDAVVTATDVTPDIEASRIQPIEGAAKGLDRITAGELELWKFISSYYLCTLGEVYKSAYPSGKIQSEEAAAAMNERRLATARRRADEAEARRQKRTEKLMARIAAREAELNRRHRADIHERLSAELSALRTELEKLSLSNEVQSVMPEAGGIAEDTRKTTIVPVHGNRLADEMKSHGSKPVLVCGSAGTREELYHALAADVLAQGRSVLFLSPEASLSKDAESSARQSGIAEEIISGCRSNDSAAHKRQVASDLRSGQVRLIFGTKAAVFLPFRNLGLIIIDEEQDSSYKQDSPAPRYNARDTAVMLASIHHAQAVLGSATPSLESMHNAHCGRYGLIMAGNDAGPGIIVELIDTSAEKRKRGMVGQISRKLIEAVNEVETGGGRAMVVTTWNDKSSLEEDASKTIPDARICNMREARMEDFGDYGLVALVQADTLLGGEDFRADEKALQLFDRFRNRCSADGRRGRFLIQTANSDHQVFKGLDEMAGSGVSAYDLLLPEREMFGFPPFSRIVDVVIRDERPKRLEFMSARIMEALYAALSPTPGIGAPVQVTGPVVPEAWKEDSGTRRTVRIILRRDSRLASRKASILDSVTRFEKEMKYTGHIIIDVDPI